MKQVKTNYQSPTLERVVMDKDISLALESPWGDPAPYSTLELGMESMPTETLMPIL
jgi:hypothetical protein